MAQQPEFTETNSQVNLKTVSYLALGDSYTIGTGSPIDLNWPNQLKEKLILDNLVALDIHIIAQNGWTTSKLLEAIERNNPKHHDLVSLMIGVNNQFQKLPFDIFKNEFNELLQRAINLSGEKGKTFVVSIPDYSVTSFGSENPVSIATDIDQYNDFIQKTCEEIKIPFVDVTGISRDLGGSQKVIADDGLHPNPFQYARWLDTIAPFVKKLIREGRN